MDVARLLLSRSMPHQELWLPISNTTSGVASWLLRMLPVSGPDTYTLPPTLVPLSCVTGAEYPKVPRA
jgi:hypothetical protein